MARKPEALLKIIKVIKNAEESGPRLTLKHFLRLFGVKVYSTVQYPIGNIEVTVASNIFWKVLEQGNWELNCIEYISNVIREGQVLLDIGSWVGPYTLLFSKLMHGTGGVYAFDCDPRAFDILQDNVQKNCLTNVHTNKVCISNSVGRAKFRLVGAGKSSLIKHQRVGLKEITVETTTLDKYCQETGVCPDGMKIDVEGAEGLVIEGGRNIIKKCAPWILLEFHSIFMSRRQRKLNWHKIVSHAEKVIFIDGDDPQYHYGSEVKSLPNCPRFHVFIKC